MVGDSRMDVRALHLRPREREVISVVQRVGFVLLLGTCAGCPSPPEVTVDAGDLPAAPAPRAWLQQPSGTVSVKRAAGDEWITAAEKMALFDNDKVRTASTASV